MTLKKEQKKVVSLISILIALLILGLIFSSNKFNGHEFKAIREQVYAIKQKTQDLSYFLINSLYTGGRSSLEEKMTTTENIKKNLYEKISQLQLKIDHINTFNTNSKLEIKQQLDQIQSSLNSLTIALNTFTHIQDYHPITEVTVQLKNALYIINSTQN